MKKWGPVASDALAGISGMLVALPGALAYGLVVFSPAVSAAPVSGALAGILGAVVLGITAAALGGTPKLVSAPCAPAAAVLGALALELVHRGVPLEAVPLLIGATGVLTGIFQTLLGLAQGGTLIKFIPYPVVAGYLTAVALIIITSQTPAFFGAPKGTEFLGVFTHPHTWQLPALLVGLGALGGMILARKFLKAFPATLAALTLGTGIYFLISLFQPGLLDTSHNPLVIGASAAGGPGSWPDHWLGIVKSWGSLTWETWSWILFPSLTLAVLLSVDTLKTCVVLDAITETRHDSNQELVAQGLGNTLSSLLGGLVGAGTAGASLINVHSGARTRMSGVWAGLGSLLVFLVLGAAIAWIPMAALAGMLFVAAAGMIDFKVLKLIKSPRTIFDLFVIVAVVATALTSSLIAAAGLGIFLTTLLFLRDQIKQSVVRRLLLGSQVHSKRHRLKAEAEVLEARGGALVVAELQGTLFFGTTDKLLTELTPVLDSAEFLILDLRRVTGLDFSAAQLLVRIRRRLEAHGGQLVFSSVPEVLVTGQHVKEYLADLGLEEEAQRLRFFPSQETALEWCEDQLLARHGSGVGRTDRELGLGEMELFEGLPPLPLIFLEMTMTSQQYAPGQLIFSSGDPGDSLIFLRRGCVRVEVPLGNGLTHHLATITQGDFFGDMSFLDQKERSANAVAETEVSVYILNRKNFDDFVRREVWAGELLYQRLAQILAERLRRNNAELKALQDR